MNFLDPFNAVVHGFDVPNPVADAQTAANAVTTVTNAVTTVKNALTAVQDLQRNLASEAPALFAGFGLFVLGALMLAFSFADDVATIAERVARSLPVPPEA